MTQHIQFFPNGTTTQDKDKMRHAMRLLKQVVAEVDTYEEAKAIVRNQVGIEVADAFVKVAIDSYVAPAPATKADVDAFTLEMVAQAIASPDNVSHEEVAAAVRAKFPEFPVDSRYVEQAQQHYTMQAGQASLAGNHEGASMASTRLGGESQGNRQGMDKLDAEIAAADALWAQRNGAPMDDDSYRTHVREQKEQRQRMTQRGAVNQYKDQLEAMMEGAQASGDAKLFAMAEFEYKSEGFHIQ